MRRLVSLAAEVALQYWGELFGYSFDSHPLPDRANQTLAVVVLVLGNAIGRGH
jgi:hypothetical protein